ncbi:hypothetical protein CYMTET_23999 [Cymbomonas tetramitiformis]|uniref:Uncharacterized protein n=1 Tax=Cymbomonas tetramitiformis TaxID=36881 RepID=A0AAE0FXE3_9CHLO|nr:hypothetical protein CYMTET_23999 [Cymbomonas tetramitiformis]
MDGTGEGGWQLLDALVTTTGWTNDWPCHGLVLPVVDSAGEAMPIDYLEPINEENRQEPALKVATKANRLEYAWFRGRYPATKFNGKFPISDSRTDCHTPKFSFVRAKQSSAVLPYPPDDMLRRTDSLPPFELEGLGDFAQEIFKNKVEITITAGRRYGAH